MPFVEDGHGLWDRGALPVRAGIISGGGVGLGATDEWAHSGTYSLVVANGSYYRVLPVARDDYYQSACLKGSYGNPAIYFLQSGAEVVSLRYDGVYWDVYVGGAKVADGTVATTRTEPQRVSVHIVTGSSGTIDTKIEGIPDVEYAGAVGSGNLDQVQWRISGVLSKFYVDDWVFGTGGWPGDRRIAYLPVISDVSVAMTPSVGEDNYACVDEVPPSNDDYVSTVIDALDQYGVQDWDDEGGDKVPHFVTVMVRVKKEDAGSDDKVTVGMSDGVNDVDGDAESVLTTYEDRWYGRALAPDGGAWTDEDIDALELRVSADIV